MSFSAGLLLAAAGVLDLGGRSEIRVRGDADSAFFDVEATPTAALRLRSPTWEASLGYAPRFTLRQVDPRASFEVLHAATLAASWRRPRTTLSLQGRGTYGTESFASLALQTAPSGSPQLDRLPETTRIDYASLRAGATLRHAASRRWLITGSVGYSLGGGTDDASRTVIPFQSGPYGSLGAEAALTRKDRLVSTLQASHARFSSGPEITVIEASEAWRRTLTRRTESSLRAGVAGALHHSFDSGARRAALYPVAEATLLHTLPADRLALRASVWIAPVVDRLSGLVDERLQGAVSGTWNVTPRLAVRGQVGAAQSIPWTGDQAIRLALADVAMSVKVNERLHVDVGTRGALQSPRGASQWIFFATMNFEAQPLRW
jgi:hypothetical protein